MDKSDYMLVLIGVLLVVSVVNLYGTMDMYSRFDSLSEKVDGLDVSGNESGVGGSNDSVMEYSVDDDPVLGSSDAPVTIIEFGDFECPFCEKFYNNTFPLIKENYIDTGKVKFVYRDFPLNSRHDYAQKAAEAAECADEQGSFWEYHDKIFENQDSIDVESLKQYAVDLGLDSSSFNTCLDDGEMTSEVNNDHSEGSSYGVTGTPTFFINDQKVKGALPYSSFKSVIDQELNETG